MYSPSLRAFSLLPQWELSWTRGGWGQACLHPLQYLLLPLTPCDWNGLAGLVRGQPKEGTLPVVGGVAWGQGPSSQQQILCTVFSIPVFE